MGLGGILFKNRLWITVFLITFFGEAEEISLSFKPFCEVTGDNILLSDIAEISGSPEAIEELSGVEVGKSAPFGRTRRLNTRRMYTFRLSRFEPRYTFNFEEKMIRIQTMAVEWSSDSILTRLQSWMDELPKTEGLRRELEIINIPEKIWVPTGSFSIEFLPNSRRGFRGKIDLPLVIKKKGKEIRTVLTSIRIRTFEKVAIVKKRLSRGESPLPVVDFEIRETTNISGIPVVDKQLLKISRLSRSVRPGTILVERMLEMIPVVSQGEVATLTIKKGDLVVSVKARCRQNGRPGEVIYVQNLANQELIRARVKQDGSLVPEGG